MSAMLMGRLLREDFRRGHVCDLQRTRGTVWRSTRDDRIARRRGDECLARADVTFEESSHGVTLCEVGEDVINGSLLCTRGSEFY